MKALSAASYAALRKKVEEVLLLGQQKIEEAKVRTYWETGRLINEYLRRSENSNQEHGQKIVVKLAEDLGFGEKVFYRCMQFAEKFPTFAARRKLSWAHYRTLFAIGDEKKRLALADEAAKGEWTSRELEIEVRNLLWDERTRASNGKPSSLLVVPVLGPFYTYSIIRPESIHDEVSGLVLDNGFSVTTDLQDRFPSCRYPEGTLVTSVKTSPGHYALRKIDPKTAKPEFLLYNYKAYVKKVIDGDTLKVSFDAGFGEKRGETIRLRGIDCPEINTPEGQAAKRFVERELGACEFITVKSTRTLKEKWGRYLGDVFYIPARSLKTSPGGVGATGHECYLNNLLLEKGYAVRVRG